MTIKLTSRNVDTTIIVSLEGTLNYGCINEVREKIDEIQKSSEANILMLDLEGISSLDSAGVGMIVSIYRNTVFVKGNQFGIIKPSMQVGTMLEAAGFTRLAKIYQSEEEALAKKSP